MEGIPPMLRDVVNPPTKKRKISDDTHISDEIIDMLKLAGFAGTNESMFQVIQEQRFGHTSANDMLFKKKKMVASASAANIALYAEFASKKAVENAMLACSNAVILRKKCHPDLDQL